MLLMDFELKVNWKGGWDSNTTAIRRCTHHLRSLFQTLGQVKGRTFEGVFEDASVVTVCMIPCVDESIHESTAGLLSLLKSLVLCHDCGVISNARTS